MTEGMQTVAPLMKDGNGNMIEIEVAVDCFPGVELEKSLSVVEAFFGLGKEGFAITSLNITRKFARVRVALREFEAQDVQGDRIRNRVTEVIGARMKELKEKRHRK